MKKIRQCFVIVLALACMLGVMPACSAATATLKLDKTSVSIQVGKTKTLKATTSVNAKKIKWSSSNKKVCTVKGDGKKATVTAKKAGKATITCKAGSKKKTCRVTVKKNMSENTTNVPQTNLSKIDMTKWQYEASDNVYWQVGISYCESPADSGYETLGIYVPGSYMSASDNGDGTYTCKLDTSAKVGDYTSQTAPIVIPVNTPGYSAMAAPNGYESSVASYTAAGFIYLHAGCRGRDAGAPAGVTDLKAAIRYARYNEGVIPGDMSRIFSFGMSGGGAQSALLGATGNSPLYTPYLEAIGAVSGVSDAVAGSMCWCPVTNLDYADEAYEWNMGNTRSGLSESQQKISDGLAAAFADYINQIGLKDENGQVLALSASAEGIYQSGTYYDYLKTVIEDSLNHFLSDTSFPYTAGTSGGNGRPGGGPGMGGGWRGPGGNHGGFEGAVSGDAFSGGAAIGGTESDIYAQDGITRDTTANAGLTGTYQTARDYIDALNALGSSAWISYDSATNTAKITDISSFTSACKNASKSLGAFDALDASQGENTLFGYGDGKGAHFDPVLAELVKDDAAYSEAFAADLAKKDALGNTVDYRMNMYNPMYYLNSFYEGYQTSEVAKYWRIRTGINQSDTALSTEVNLALALRNYGRTVDFETVWGQGHVEAERSGDSTSNFISWVSECLK